MKNRAGHRWFEGWYFKHQNSDTVVSVIPGLSVDSRGDPHAFIQLITEEGAYYAAYNPARYQANWQGPVLTVGESRFTPEGITLKVEKSGCKALGSLRYSPFTPLQGDIMGPFAHLPAMECRHGIVSLFHQIEGSLTINDKTYCFDGGLGYIERDWGRSFPQGYRWVQCAGREEGGWCAFASAAKIPYLGLRFTGCIAVVYHKGKEHRFATYNGARVQYNSEHGLTFLRGRHRLAFFAQPSAAHRLRAPQQGQMCRGVDEAVCCPVTVRLWEGEKLIFEGHSNQGSLESIP